jgi:hypothetical protein
MAQVWHSRSTGWSSKGEIDYSSSDLLLLTNARCNSHCSYFYAFGFSRMGTSSMSNWEHILIWIALALSCNTLNCSGCSPLFKTFRWRISRTHDPITTHWSEWHCFSSEISFRCRRRCFCRGCDQYCLRFPDSRAAGWPASDGIHFERLVALRAKGIRDFV